MSGKKKNRNQEKATKLILLITAIIHLITAAVSLAEQLMK